MSTASITEKAFSKAVTLTQFFLSGISSKIAITPQLIQEQIEEAISIMARSHADLVGHVNKKAVLEEVIRRSSQTSGKNTTLSNNEDHEDWLNSERKADWKYWPRYAQWLEIKMSESAIEALDESTDDVLRQLEDPNRQDNWDRRGLVVGHVQSGKTAHYTGIICKAADAGYKIIIVLAGLHNNLRSQTQVRLEEGFLGYATIANADLPDIGVGEINNNNDIKPNSATNRLEKGDFDKRSSRTLAVRPDQRPWLFVVKKNKTVLERLQYWIQNHVWDTKHEETKRKIVTQLPLLIIDDEADHGSVDTGEQVYDELGNPNPEYEPKTINRLIRSILCSFSRKAYVGYTATPFANIFIHHKAYTQDFGLDLFPSSFIVNLAAPSNYIGPSKVFGATSAGNENNALLRDLNDEEYCHWMPQNHKNGHRPRSNGEDDLPDSLKEAIIDFILACVIRHFRGQGRKHSSMLIHVTRFTSVQKEVVRQVKDYIKYLNTRFKRNIDTEQIIEKFKLQWLNNFGPKIKIIQSEFPDIISYPENTWEEIEQLLPSILSDIHVKEINGSAKDALEYIENEATGLKVIAVGGDKLARGLTLEGLCTSYFLRTAKMYDTLMQMGRWFGYRDGYLDLCRLYTTPELITWFNHIADASEQLREEFDVMANTGGTPNDFGLKVLSHSTMSVTSPLKMKNAQTLHLSFSGDLVQTIVFPLTKDRLESNLKAGERLLSNLPPATDLSNQRFLNGHQVTSGYLWRNISSQNVIGFLREYETHRESTRVVSGVIANFIEEMNLENELINWTIALIGKKGHDSLAKISNYDIQMIERKRSGDYPDRYSIKTLISPQDELVDLTQDQWDLALSMTQNNWVPDSGRNRSNIMPTTPSGPFARAVRGAKGGRLAELDKGLLMLYLIDPNKSNEPKIKDFPPILAWAISFPGSNSGRKVPYQVNTVLWRQLNATE